MTFFFLFIERLVCKMSFDISTRKDKHTFSIVYIDDTLRIYLKGRETRGQRDRAKGPAFNLKKY